jgi:hypothetical protein
MSLQPGTRLGAYEIAGTLGADGMGEVYRATDTNLGRQVPQGPGLGVTFRAGLDLVDGIDAPNVWYGVDTAVAIATLLNNNVATKYPNIRWVFSHAGGGFPALAGRIINLRADAAGGGRGAAPAGGGRGAAAAGGGGRGAAAAGGGRGARNSDQGLREARMFYYDCAASTNRFTLQALAALVTNSQLVFGSDYPWSNIVSLTTALPDCGFTPAQLNALNYENGERMASAT